MPGRTALLAYRTKVLRQLRNHDPNLAKQLENVRLDWYTIRNAADSESGGAVTEVLIYDEIGGLCGIPADEFVANLQEIDTPRIHVRINSPGGSLFDSIAIYNALVKHPARVTCYVDALAASGASIIAMSADPYDSAANDGGVVMMVGSQLMIHDALGVEQGNAAAFREMSDFLDRQSDNIATIYAAKSGNPDVAMWRDMMLAETWLFAQEAVDLALADAVYTRPTAEPDVVPEPPIGDPETDSPNPLTEEDTEESVDNLMQRRHHLAARGYRYAGRW